MSKRKAIVALSGGVDSAISAYLLKKQGFELEAVFMQNWDARDESSTGHCTLDSDLKSIDITCKTLGISKLHHVNFQSIYWQKVFTPVLRGYQTGDFTPNPDILCNREIKFGELIKWCDNNVDASNLATGHYARIHSGQLRQSFDLQKDQTYFLAAIDRMLLNRLIFPVGNFLKSDVKSKLLVESGLIHLLSKKESMGLCFIGKRKNFGTFLNEFVEPMTAGPIIDYDSGDILTQQHSGLCNDTIGQSIGLGGIKARMYVANKNIQTNTIFAVHRLDHPLLNPNSLTIEYSKNIMLGSTTFCSIRSNDKIGTRVTSLKVVESKMHVELDGPVFAPSLGQWAVFYDADTKSSLHGRVCLGGSQILKSNDQTHLK